MWSWIKKVIVNNPVKSVSIFTVIASLNFVVNLLQALSDGVIDDTEWHNLMLGANGVEALILGIIAVALKIGSK